MKRHRVRFENKHQFLTAIREAWRDLPRHYFTKLCLSMPNRLLRAISHWDVMEALPATSPDITHGIVWWVSQRLAAQSLWQRRQPKRYERVCLATLLHWRRLQENTKISMPSHSLRRQQCLQFVNCHCQCEQFRYREIYN
jgi:hypothetical protein